MQIVASGSPLTFEYAAYDESSVLSVAMKVYDITTIGSPVLVATTGMTHIFGGAYVANFTPVVAKQYLIHKAVYTDGSYTTLDPLRSPATETFLASSAAGGVLTPTDIMNVKDAVWDEPQSGHTTAGTFGANLDTTVSSRASDVDISAIDALVTNINANTVPSVIAQDVWNAARSGFNVGGSFGAALQGILSSARASLLDNLSRLDVVLSTRAQQTTADAILADTDALATNYTSGRATKLDHLDADVSTRATQSSVSALPSDASIAFAVWQESLAAHTGAGTTGKKLGDISLTVPPTAATIAAAVWDEAAAGHTTAGTFGLRFDVAISSRASDADMQLVKGTGFVTGNDSLHALRGKVDTLPTSAGDATAANQATILSAVNTRSSQASVTAAQSAIAAIPTNPVLTTDVRVGRLDVAVSTRASQSSLDSAMGVGFTSGTDDLHSIRTAVVASVDLTPVLTSIDQVKGASFNSATDGLHANATAVAAATSAANSAASAAATAAATAATRASQSSVNTLQTSVNAIPTNPALASDSRFAYLDANVSSRADAATVGQILGSGFNPATDSLHAIKTLVAALAPGDATAAQQLAILAAISTLATAAGLSAVAAAVAAIPVNPLLTTDSRLNRLDVAVSTRATDADMQLVKGPGFNPGTDSLHDIKTAVPPAFDVSTVITELQKIEGTGFTTGADDLKHANATAKTERAQIYADTQSLLSNGEPF